MWLDPTREYHHISAYLPGGGNPCIKASMAPMPRTDDSLSQKLKTPMHLPMPPSGLPPCHPRSELKVSKEDFLLSLDQRTAEQAHAMAATVMAAAAALPRRTSASSRGEVTRG